MYPPDCIFIFDNVFTDAECKYLIEMTNKYTVKGRETYGPAANVLADSVNSLEIPDTEDQKKVRDLTFEKVIKLCKIFKEEYGIEMGGFVSPTLRKITGATRQHSDGVVLAKQVRDGMCPASELRNMAVVVALNGDYEGGEFCFPEQGRTIKLKKGTSCGLPTVLDTPPLHKRFGRWYCTIHSELLDT